MPDVHLCCPSLFLKEAGGEALDELEIKPVSHAFLRLQEESTKGGGELV